MPRVARSGLGSAGSNPAPARGLDRAWTDPFGTAIATLEGGVGGRVVLVVAPPEVAGEALAALLAVGPFRGRLALAVPERIHAALLEAVFRVLEPAVVVALEPGLEGVATTGPAAEVEAGRHAASTGLQYLEPGGYPAWSGGWLAGQLEPSGAYPSRAASLAAARNIAAVACGLGELPRVLGAALG